MEEYFRRRLGVDMVGGRWTEDRNRRQGAKDEGKGMLSQKALPGKN
jgi:hypothetical protein